ncbi:GntR family transcriptional regulator [Cellulomonas alba]|uniref:GntR family transcriptional regulator n=1 Tax=Cellulomonas alba TaxID=3053467 RepID=A0ABT7SCJ7_9CELL|nr:GntR family transcriptional regulator [Cellulomonas alba]MDM7853914.1 GntR family transcriptional regulator [Cellulomonas alba]
MSSGSSAGRTDLDADAPRSQRDKVYLALRDALLDGTLSPFERLGEVRLAERFETSRTPVREALARLRSDGLVEKRDGGLYLHVPSLEGLVELYELRITLELRGIQRAVEDPTLHHDRAVLEPELVRWYEMRDRRPEPSARFVVTDEAFHTTLLRSAGNGAMSDALTTVNRQIRPVRMYDYLTEDRMEATVDEHIEIAEKVLSGSLRQALDALHAHIGASRDVVTERAARVLSAANLVLTR